MHAVDEHAELLGGEGNVHRREVLARRVVGRIEYQHARLHASMPPARVVQAAECRSECRSEEGLRRNFRGRRGADDALNTSDDRCAKIARVANEDHCAAMLQVRA